MHPAFPKNFFEPLIVERIRMNAELPGSGVHRPMRHIHVQTGFKMHDVPIELSIRACMTDQEALENEIQLRTMAETMNVSLLVRGEA